MKIVFDTNVYLAAAKRGSYAGGQLRRSGPNGPYRLYISPDIILEIREKLEEKFHWSREKSVNYIEELLEYAELVYPHERIVGVLEDTDDHIVLECAVESDADAIVTSDRGLLRLKEFRSISIIHPTMLQYLV